MSKPKLIIAGLCCLVFVTLAFIVLNTQKPYKNAIITARTEIWKDINSGKCSNASVAIMVDGKIVYAEGFGMANREKSIPVDKNTLLNIGSISKVFTAAAMMELIDEGKISLDKPVPDYLPEFKMADNRYKNITVRMLLNHTSGIPGTEGANSFGFKYYDNIQKETLNTLARSHLIHTPGTLAVYCNDGFTLAEMIIEKVSGKKYIDFLKEKILTPLGLKKTGLSVGEIQDKVIAAYYDPKTAKMQPFETLSVLGAGGLSSTPIDLDRFADTFSSNNKIFAARSLAEMKKPQPGTSPLKLKNAEISFGLGWDFTSLPQYESRGIHVLGKSGGTGNYSSMLFTVPEKRISVAVICTGPESNAMGIALDVLDAVLVGKKIIKPGKKSVAISPESQNLPKGDLSFGGYYANGNQLYQMTFDTEKNNVIVYKFDGKEKTPAITLIYNKGYYYDLTENMSFYFLSTNENAYFVNYLSPLKMDMVVMQKIKPVENAKQLQITMDEKQWLRRNVDPFESISGASTHDVKSFLYPDLPGYVVLQGIKQIEAPDFAGMPLDAIRDQTELTLFDHHGEIWAWVSDMLYSPADKTIALKVGKNLIKIGKDNYNEWRTVNENLILSFKKPKNSRIIIFSSEGEPTYDSAMDTGDAGVLKGSLIEMAGFAGDKFVVKAKSTT